MKVGICSLGCKVNIYESEYVEEILKNAGYEIVSFEEVADIYIINTCSVTNEADKKSRKMINQAKRKNVAAIIIVMGCYIFINNSNITKEMNNLKSNVSEKQRTTDTLKDNNTLNVPSKDSLVERCFFILS